jgi:uncharacterized delta-60 repeat protein
MAVAFIFTHHPVPASAVDGIVTTDFGAHEEGSSVALQPDGKIVVAGTSGNSLALVRYNPNGSLDTSFGTGGLISGGARGTFGLSLVSQLDGKILVGRPVDASGRSFLATRYDTNGSVDTAFGAGGDVSLDIITSGDHSLALQLDGKILIAGAVSPGITFASHITVARLDQDGSLDAGFGTDGKATTGSGHGGLARSIILQPDSKIVVAGNASINPTGNNTIALVRHSPDGSPDTSFGSGGIVTTGIAFHTQAHDLALQPDSKIVVVGNAQDLSVGTLLALARYNPDGSLDATFDTDGIVASDLGAAHSIELQPDGKIVVAGVIGTDHVLLRFKPDGTLDPSFGTGGKVVTDLLDNRLALQADGKILVAGSISNGTDSDFALARYNSDGSLDASFGSGTALPAAPAITRATPLDGGVALALSPASESDARLVTGYHVEFSTSGETIVEEYPADADGTTAAVLRGLRNDTPYSFKASAMSSQGVSQIAPIVSVTPQSAPQPCKDWAAKFPNPVLLAHGWNATSETWDDTVEHFTDCGWLDDDLKIEDGVVRGRSGDPFPAELYTVTFTGFVDGTGAVDNPCAQALELERFLAAVRQARQATKVVIVGHSQGGLVTRLYMQWGGNGGKWLDLLDGGTCTASAGESLHFNACIDLAHGHSNFFHDDVAALITYGTPHKGVDDLPFSHYLHHGCIRTAASLSISITLRPYLCPALRP